MYAGGAGAEAQIVSLCNIYEGGEKKTVFKYLAEKVLNLQFSFLHIEHLHESYIADWVPGVASIQYCSMCLSEPCKVFRYIYRLVLNKLIVWKIN